MPKDFFLPYGNSPALPIFDNPLSENYFTFCHKSYVSGAYHSEEQGKQGSLFTSFAIYTNGLFVRDTRPGAKILSGKQAKCCP